MQRLIVLAALLGTVAAAGGLSSNWSGGSTAAWRLDAEGGAPSRSSGERCMCIERPGDGLALRAYTAQELQRAGAVFLGVVDSAVRSEEGTQRMRVNRWYKGGTADTITIVVRPRPPHMTTCDLLLRPGEQWLIFAHRAPTGELRTGFCTGSRPREQADSTLQYLGLGWQPRVRDPSE
jgi:hypothetical protein